MKTKIHHFLAASAVTIIAFSSCKKESTTGEDISQAGSGLIAIGTTSASTFASTTTSTDSLYLVNCHTRREKHDAVAFSSLPAAATAYLSDNYAGYTAAKAFKIADAAGTVTNYIAVISVNGNLAGLKFTADGTFVSVLEQRAGTDLHGRGWHEGGPFCNRDGVRRDTIALTAIPAAVKTYFSTSYATDTLVHAYTTHDTTYVLISKNKGLWATGITAAGKLVKRIQVSARPAKPVAVSAANLPSAIGTYLSATYPAYVFNKAFAASLNGAVQEYNVFITANNTNYAVKFSAAGVFLKATVVR